ncbi:MAG: hypothetical protein CM1200mP26_25180 [Acidimicrobiales bacterium]|nr:MAG: hypothetical protein CM1200mP26_25180 [Acidimicrobiales bacterium]
MRTALRRSRSRNRRGWRRCRFVVVARVVVAGLSVVVVARVGVCRLCGFGGGAGGGWRSRRGCWGCRGGLPALSWWWRGWWPASWWWWRALSWWLGGGYVVAVLALEVREHAPPATAATTKSAANTRPFLRFGRPPAPPHHRQVDLGGHRLTIGPPGRPCRSGGWTMTVEPSGKSGAEGGRLARLKKQTRGVLKRPVVAPVRAAGIA